MKVKNLHDGSRRVPSGYRSWLEYWMREKGVSTTPNCANTECQRRAVHGGHVKKVASTDNSWYIVPLCASCNETKDLEFEVDRSSMVSLN